MANFDKSRAVSSKERNANSLRELRFRLLSGQVSPRDRIGIPMMSKVRVAMTECKLVAVLSLVCGTLLLVSGCGHSDAAASTKSDKSDEKPLPKVEVARPITMPIVEWDEFIGRLAAIETVEVRARVSGYLATSNFQEGQMVKAGDVLVVVDQRPFQAEISRSRAALLSAQAQLGEAQAEVARTQADKVGRVVRVDLALKQLQRMRQLRERNTATQEELEVREAEHEQAVAEREVGDTLIKAAEASVVAAEAAVGTAQANLELAELNFQYTEVRAPITGRISRLYVTEGNLVSGGTADSTLLTTIVSTDPIHCYFDADENTFLKYMKLAKKGERLSSRDVRNPVYLALANEKDGFPRQGHMDFVENRFDETTATIRGRAILPNPNGELAPGLFARVRLPGSPRYEAVLIPDRAISTDQAEKFVMIVEDGVAQRRRVELGPISHGLRVIRDGLTGAEQLIVSGLQRAKPGTEVEVEEKTIPLGKESLPDEYEPVPEDKWLTPKRGAAANVTLPDSRPGVLKSTSLPEKGGLLP
jgi:multidrug efflux system membrane fusion protein